MYKRPSICNYYVGLITPPDVEISSTYVLDYSKGVANIIII